ncbi:MAG: GAF domain-containing protein [Deltaproteobacteria bacterium]|nr:GAF domain-containing protein [Deltaproteobacteria bacterium]
MGSRQEVEQIVKRGAEFTEELMKDNERLRFRVAQLESRQESATADAGLVRELVEKIGRLEAEREEMEQRFAAVEAENKDFASRYVEIEAENSNLLNIYVASYQLHSTLDFQEVLQIITEIVVNFVGAEVFGIALVEEMGKPIRVLVAEGIDRASVGRVPTDRGVIGQVLKSGTPYFADEISGPRADAGKPMVCIPLKIKDQIIGLILIYRFFEQKTRLAPVDHELFTLLAGHAATAIFAAKLYTDSKRKLNTIQGFIDLMTS